MRVPAPALSGLVLAGLVAACGGGSGATAPAPSLTPPATTTAAAPTASGAAPSVAPTAGAATPSRSGTAPAAAAPTPSRTGAPTTSAPPPAAGQRVATGFTPTGTFTYDQSGSFSNGDAPPPTGTLAVDAPQGSTQHTRASEGDGDTDTTLEHRADGLHLVALSVTGPSGQIVFQPADRPVFLPTPAKNGQTWAFTTVSTDGKYTLQASFKAGAATTTTVGGTGVPTTPVHAVLTVTATGVDVVETLDAQVDTSRALQLTTHDVTKGKAFGFSFGADVTQTLRSLTPA